MVERARICQDAAFIMYMSKVGDHSWGWPEGSLFNSFYTEVLGRVLLLSLDCSTLPLIHTLYCWVLSKEVSSSIFKVFGMMQAGIEPMSPRPLANILPTCPMSNSFASIKWRYNFWIFEWHVSLLVNCNDNEDDFLKKNEFF